MTHAATSAHRLAALRAELERQQLAGFLIPRGDEHLGEYVAPSAERLAWLTGFTGSAGLAVVLAGDAAVWSDGRYVLQLAAETDPGVWQRLHLTDAPPPAWIAARIAGGPLGYDPWLHSEDGLKPFRDAGLTLRPLVANPLDAVWTDRPPPPPYPATPHELAFAGLASADKREQVATTLRDAGQDAAIISDPASLAWLLNIRGTDLEATPVALGFAIAHADARVDLFMAGAKLPPDTRVWLGNGVAIAEPAQLRPALARLAGRRIRVDPANTAAWFAERLREAGAIVAAGQDPCLLPKACKNPTEQQGARAAQLRDATALARFLHWLGTAAGHQTELSAVAKLQALRAECLLYRGDSFAVIAGAGEHSAVIHYRATPSTDRPLRANEVFLIDSGGQYPDGTTDVTRTIWTGPGMPPPALRDRYTRVLKGHIAIASLVFPVKVAGVRLDAFARAALWQAGLDFDHGTGHGVGSFLSVHEGPASISPHLRPAPLAAGMILSNEPGFYLPGQYGIRLENLVLVQPALLNGERPFLRFETLTWAPFDRQLIEPTLLTTEERGWLDRYHAQVHSLIAPSLPPDTAAWLAQACATLKVS